MKTRQMQQSLKEIGPPFYPSGNEMHASRAGRMLGTENQVPLANHAKKMKNYPFFQFPNSTYLHPAHSPLLRMHAISSDDLRAVTQRRIKRLLHNSKLPL